MQSYDVTQVEQYRSSGWSWAMIAQATGLNEEALRSRFRRHRKKQEQTTREYSVIGQGPDDGGLAIDQIWQAAFNASLSVSEKIANKKANLIELPVPCALVLLSDLHIGNAYCDYEALREDASIIQTTPGMYAEFHGDGVDNWIIGKLAALQRNQAMNYDTEWRLFIDWLEMLEGKLVAVVAGNHDNWTEKMAGIDRVREALKGTKVLYGGHQVVFDLVVGPSKYKVKVRHKWKYGSVFNPTHNIEVGWERGGDEFDIGIGGHTHIATLCRPFIRNQRMRYAILTGTYKVHDSFGEEIGFAPPYGRGSGALVFDSAGLPIWIEDLRRAADYLTFLRERGS